MHHSDRGVQYASADHTELLEYRGIAIGMSRKGNPWDNAKCESLTEHAEVMKTFTGPSTAA